MTVGTIAYDSQSGNTTTTQEVIDAVTGLRNKSSKLNSMVTETLNNGDNIDIQLMNGTLNPFNGQSAYAYCVIDPSNGVIKIFISEEYLETVNYKTNYSTGANAPTSLERALAHELVHAWQKSTGLTSTGDVGEEQAAQITNDIMKLYGEAPREGDPTSGAPTYTNSVVTVTSHSVTSHTPAPPRDVPSYVDSISDGYDAGEANSSPLILDLDDSGTIDLISLANSDAFWDNNQNGFRSQSSWVDSVDGLLALDVNADGIINDNGELFGTMDADGFSILSQYDSNSDGYITSEDSVWEDLIIWQDVNENGYSEEAELHTLEDYDIVSIDLNAVEVSQTNQGNVVSHTSTFVVDDGVNPADTRIIHDVWFEYDPINTIYSTDFALDVDALMLPVDLRGYGTIPDLHISMSLDNTGTGNLLGLVTDFSDLSFADLFDETSDLMGDVADIMYRWAGVDGVATDSRGSNIDARQLEFLEQMMGQDFLQRDVNPNPGPKSAEDLEEAFFIAQQNIFARLVAQSAGGDLFEGDWYYDMSSDSIEGVTGLDSTVLATLESEATGFSTTGEREIFWGNVVRMIEYTVGTTNLPGGDQTALDTAITDSDATLDLTDILDSLEFVGDTGAAYYGTSGNDTITAVSGADVISGGYGDDTLSGGNGNDTINGEGDDDILSGDADNDYLLGGSGDDQYLYSLGDGDDTIRESSTGAGNFDEIVFGSGIDSGDLTFTRLGTYDLLIEIDTGSQTGQIYIENQFNYGAGGGHVEQITFYDTSTYDLDGQNWTTYGTAGDDVIVGVRDGYGGLGTDTIYGGAGNDTIYDAASGESDSKDDTLYGEDGNDTLIAEYGDDTLYGGAGDDYLSGGGGDDHLYAGTGNDYMTGGPGSDHYYYTSGHLELLGATADTIHLDAAWDSVTPDYFKIGNDLQLFFNATNTITILGFFSTTPIHDLVYDDTTTVDLSGITYVTQGTSGNDTIGGTSGDDLIYGFAGDDTLNASGYGDGNDIVYGGTGDDALYGGRDDDYLDGGAGDDSLQGGTGNDTYYYVSGNDDAYDTGGTDVLEIDGAWDYGDLTIGRYIADLNDLVIGFGAGSVNSVYITDMFSSRAFETLRMNDGTGDIDLTSIGYTTYGTASGETIGGIINANFNSGDTNDTIYGYGGNDTLDGHDGDDILYGGDGDDTIYGGYGDDVIWGGADDDVMRGEQGDDLYVYEGGLDEVRDAYSGTADAIWITNGVVIDEISIANTGSYDTTITITASTDEIFVYRQNYGPVTNHIEILRFDDGFETDEFESYGSWMWGTSGNDTSAGNSSNNVMIGDAGNDDMDAGAGDDDVHGGAGNDDIHGDDGDDFLHGGADDDTLYGDDGLDTLWGGTGDDTFTFDATTAYNDVDVIADFSVSEDFIDIADLLDANYDFGVDDLTDFVQITDNGTDSTLSVDADGGADSFVAVASILGVTGLTDVTALETSGALVTV